MKGSSRRSRPHPTRGSDHPTPRSVIATSSGRYEIRRRNTTHLSAGCSIDDFVEFYTLCRCTCVRVRHYGSFAARVMAIEIRRHDFNHVLTMASRIGESMSGYHVAIIRQWTERVASRRTRRIALQRYRPRECCSTNLALIRPRTPSLPCCVALGGLYLNRRTLNHSTKTRRSMSCKVGNPLDIAQSQTADNQSRCC